MSILIINSFDAGSPLFYWGLISGGLSIVNFPKPTCSFQVRRRTCLGCLKVLNITNDKTNIREGLKTFEFKIYQKTCPIICYCWLERTNRVWNFWQGPQLVGEIIMKTNQLRQKNFTISALSILLWKNIKFESKGKLLSGENNKFLPTYFGQQYSIKCSVAI